MWADRSRLDGCAPSRLPNPPGATKSGAREGIRTPGLPITNRLRYHCATRARMPFLAVRTPDSACGPTPNARNKNSPRHEAGYARQYMKPDSGKSRNQGKPGVRARRLRPRKREMRRVGVGLAPPASEQKDRSAACPPRRGSIRPCPSVFPAVESTPHSQATLLPPDDLISPHSVKST